ncbi:MAG TPA: tRNA (adenosine(37)-N6)-dimethylallyltransferase MiaA [Mycobacteriales bacterium]|nr:tRNA (adenosine(37)-N6)-dimethylallyltransferase MiaA [Mycobacteriales bacterium]
MTVAVIAVVGPTAVGKSAAAIELARRLGGEVVNADSMQLYRGMDIGTAKLAPADRGGVAHHLLDVLDVRETATVAGYQALARATIDGLLARGIPPVLVGGSGLYLQAALDALTFPGTDAEIRLTLEAELAELGAEALHARLVELDPDAAAKIHPANGRRTVRALEVITLTGEPYSASGPGMTAYQAHYRAQLLGLDLPTDVLDERIAQRVDRMWAAGLVDEVRTLAARGLRDGVTASRALGYAQVLALLAGDYDEAEARARTIAATRRYVRRQRSWFRRDPRILWHDDASELVNGAVEMARPGYIGLPGVKGTLQP